MNYELIIQVGDVLVSPDVITEKFCCDLDACKGACCVEGDAGAPVTLDEIAGMEDALDAVWPGMSAGAQAVVDRQGVAYNDPEGELVTSIVDGKDCVFTCHEGGVCLCLLEKAYRDGKLIAWQWYFCQHYEIFGIHKCVRIGFGCKIWNDEKLRSMPAQFWFYINPVK